MVRVEIVRQVDVAANSTSFISLYTCAPAKTCKIEEIAISFPVNTLYELRAYFYINELLVIPTTPDYPIVGENVTITFKPNLEVRSGETLRVKLVNVNTTQIRSCVIKVEGEEQ